jgi:hypothetical protein
MRRLLVAMGLLLASSGAWAAQDFTCGKSKVSIFVSGNKSAAWELRVRSTVLVTTPEGASASISYTGNIDFIGGHCVTDAAGQPRILLAPNDTNRDEARRILGADPVPPSEMTGVFREGRRIGIDIPKEAGGHGNLP